MLRRLRMPAVAISMAMYFSLLCSCPAVAGLLPSLPSSVQTADTVRGGEIAKVQKALEQQIVIDKLTAYGLSTDEVNAKLQSLSDEQLHMMAQASDRLLAGGDGLGVVIALLVIVILVILILKLLDKKIIVK